MENKAKFLGVIFDRRLNWKSHIDYIMEKCKKRLNLMRAVSGYHWGASKKSLLAIYKALIRSILDYGDVAYSSACKSYLDKLTSIQTEAMRICCGAPRGTAALTLQNECGELPLHLRRLNNSIKMGMKILGSKDHPGKSIIQPHWTDYFKTQHSKGHSLYYRTHEFIDSLNTSLMGPSFPSSPPWTNRKVEIDTSLVKKVNKKLDNPDYLKLNALELMSKYNLLTHIYTDGSKAEDIVAAAFTIPSLAIDRKYRLCNKSSVYAAELTAIKEAIVWILTSEYYKDHQFVIFSDSLSVLTSMKENSSKSRPNLFNELMMHLSKLDTGKVKFVWIPSHVDLSGNDRADTLAKEALSLDHVNSTNYIEMQEIYTLIKPNIIEKWQKEYDDDHRGSNYKTICQIVNTDIKLSDPNRQLEVQITRLRLGMANTNYRLFKIGKHPSGLCDVCNVKDDIEHLLLRCKKENIGNILRNKCDLYKSDFNLKTLLNEGHLQRTIYSLIKIINKGKIL
jgi:ribonuclease HI